MKPATFNRLHILRQENVAAGYAQAEMAPRFARLADRHENGCAPRVVVAYQLFQTPVAVAAQMAALLDCQPGARVLEPSAGLGRLLDALAPYAPGQVVAVEMAGQCAGELYRQERPGVVIKQRDFLTCTPDELGLFDAVICNPPFHLRAEIAHVMHALKFLRPGGRLVGLCLDTPHRVKALCPLASEWRALDAGAFRESGTQIQAVMFLITKPMK